MTWSPEPAARWLAEAAESGNPLAPLPPEMAPRTAEEGEDIAFATLETLDLVPCGVRVLRHEGAVLVGPMLEARLLGSGAAAGGLRHPMVTAAAVGLLAAPLAPEARTAPRFTRIHPALDIAATRFSAVPAAVPDRIADLALLGLVVAGAGVAAKPGTVAIAFGAKGGRPKPVLVDLAAAFAEAAATARRLGGLPKGALLVAAGLTPPRAAAGVLRARLGALGAAEVVFAA